jgi:hypothetical protein
VTVWFVAVSVEQVIRLLQKLISGLSDDLDQFNVFNLVPIVFDRAEINRVLWQSFHFLMPLCAAFVRSTHGGAVR